MEQPHKLMIVMPPGQQEELLSGLAGGEWSFTFAQSVVEGERQRQSMREADVVVVALRLEDGNWRSIYRDLANLSSKAEVVVALPSTLGNDRIVLQLGAAGVIRPPFSSPATRAVIEAAANRVRA